MKKREVYKGWRYPCETDMFVGNYGLLSFNSTDSSKNIIRSLNIPFTTKKEALIFSCPCGKGCKPIKCNIIVENEVEQ